MTARLLGAAGAVAGCLAFLVLAAPAAAQSPASSMVPVTQPDELGQPVSIDTDVYVPDGGAPPSGWPLVIVFHGGGGSKSGGFEVFRAQELTRHGYAALVYSARGHGDSGGQLTAFGPKEMRDLFDVTEWALDNFPLDRSRIASFGESQGGLHTNLGQVYADDPGLDPYGIDFKALVPGNTPDYVYEALVQKRVLKLSFGAGLLQTYYIGASGNVSPLVGKWTAALAADQPAITGNDLCDSPVHDTATSTLLQDLAVRSPGCFVDRMTPPSLWSQSFDDGLFPADMGISMWRRMPNTANRLYLLMGGHGAPSRLPEAESDQLRAQIAFIDSVLKPGTVAPGQGAAGAQQRWIGKPTVMRGKRKLRKAKRLQRQGRRHAAKRKRKKGKRLIRKGRKMFESVPGAGAGGSAGPGPGADLGPRVVYWRRDPRIAVPSSSYRYQDGSWTRHTSPTWPPPGTAEETLQLSGDGNAVASGATTGSLPLGPPAIDPGSDPVAQAAASATPIGTSPVPSQVPATNVPGFIAAFTAEATGADRELSGQVSADLAWTPLSPDTQLVLKLLDRAPDGTVTLLTRGVAGVRGATPGAAQQVHVDTNTISSLIPAGHTLLAWVSAGELSFYKPFVPSLGGVLAAGAGSTLTLPLKNP